MSKPKVLGIGGIFFKSKDPAALREWYRKHLGMDIQNWGGMAFDSADSPGQTVWNPFKADTQYFAPSTASFMINYRVDDVRALVAQLRAEGCEVDEKIDDSEYGIFGWVMDPEGNRLELWQAPPAKA
jgi:predicted enzyme related to lactoylglutathione lyase